MSIDEGGWDGDGPHAGSTGGAPIENKGYKDLTGRQIYNISGVVEDKILWTDVPKQVRDSIETILNRTETLEKASSKSQRKEHIINVLKYADEDRMDWPNIIRFGLKYNANRKSFVQQKNELTLNVLYNSHKNIKPAIPQELWVCNEAEGRIFTGSAPVYILDSNEAIELYIALLDMGREKFVKVVD